MKLALPWHSAIRKLKGAGLAIGRFLGPFPPAGPGASFMPAFRVHASYGRFVFSVHALAPREESLRRVDVHDAFTRSRPEQADDPARSSAERVVIVRTPCPPQVVFLSNDRTDPTRQARRSHGLP